ncbi:hypothetical protein [Kitasatospora sp. NPDC002965]|uniref:hypothetical protein n=1 Tax=Kitasatospora sp. NPDC002965 TaxID=3154775 RepID=UPI0033A03B22
MSETEIYQPAPMNLQAYLAQQQYAAPLVQTQPLQPYYLTDPATGQQVVVMGTAQSALYLHQSAAPVMQQVPAAGVTVDRGALFPRWARRAAVIVALLCAIAWGAEKVFAAADRALAHLLHFLAELLTVVGEGLFLLGLAVAAGVFIKAVAFGGSEKSTKSAKGADAGPTFIQNASGLFARNVIKNKW